MKNYLMLLCAAIAVVSCDGTYQYADYSFTILSSGTVQFDGFENVPEEKKQHISGTVYIPEYIYGRKVTHIGSRAFLNCSALTGVVMPDTITHIGSRAFLNCSALTGVVMPDTITHIGSYAFAKSGITSITIPKNVIKIEDSAFYDCESLTRVVFEEPNSWKADSSHLSLTDPHQNAIYLKSTYEYRTWTRE